MPSINHILKRLFFVKYKQKNFDYNIYWDERYKKGLTSGSGSYNNLAEFKAEVINNFVAENNIESVIEFGCGDGNQLKQFNFKNYLGYDISEYIVEKCRANFKGDATKKFEHINKYAKQLVDLTLSLDVIYHVVDDTDFEKYMYRLFECSNRFVIIYSSNNDKLNTTAKHIKHRQFTTWVDKNVKVFNLLTYIPNKFQYEEKMPDNTSLADFYIYENSKKHVKI